MATVQTRINRAVRLLGQVTSNTDVPAAESADALVALNAMIGAWRNERMMCYALQTESLSLSASDADYTIGSGGNLNTTRPVAIEQAWILDGTNSYPVRLISDQEYNAIGDKTTESDWPTVANYRPTMSTGTLYVWPVPNASRTMKLSTRVVVSSFSALADTVTLPPGWEEALATNLAVEIAPEYEMEAPGGVLSRAAASKASIKRVNSRPIIATTDVGLMSGGHSNILLGE